MANTITKKLRPEIIQEIRNSLRLKNRLQFELEVSNNTIYLWLKNNSSQLTTYAALEIISNELNIKMDDLLT